MVAPVSLRENLNALFDREITHQNSGRPARITAKFNRLADQQIIEKLYEVSRAGVQIDLIVRGICMLGRAFQVFRITSGCAILSGAF